MTQKKEPLLQKSIQKTYDITYLDAAAITDPKAQEIIKETIDEIKGVEK